MSLPDENNEKLQELAIIVSDRVRSVDRKWWYALILTFVLCIPAYFALRSMFASLKVSGHKFPSYIYEDETKIPLEIIDRKVFSLGNGSYSGYIRIRNSANYDWGAAAQAYTAVFRTTGGTEVKRFNNSTFILPASEKIIVLPRFSSSTEPTTMEAALGETQFIRKPSKPQPSLSIERVNLSESASQLTVAAAVRNSTPFTIKRIGLPVLLYDRNNQIVGVNYTNIDDVTYAETRSFQFVWPNRPAAVRAEILPEVNIFDPGIYRLPEGTPQF